MLSLLSDSREGRGTLKSARSAWDHTWNDHNLGVWSIWVFIRSLRTSLQLFDAFYEQDVNMELWRIASTLLEFLLEVAHPQGSWLLQNILRWRWTTSSADLQLSSGLLLGATCDRPSINNTTLYPTSKALPTLSPAKSCRAGMPRFELESVPFFFGRIRKKLSQERKCQQKIARKIQGRTRSLVTLPSRNMNR